MCVKISFQSFLPLKETLFNTECNIANFKLGMTSKTADRRYYQVSAKYAFNIFHLRILDFLDSPKTPHRQY